MLVVRMHLWKSSGCHAYECCVFLLEVVRIGEARHVYSWGNPDGVNPDEKRVTCTLGKIRMGLIRMRMCITRYQKICATCCQGGSPHKCISKPSTDLYCMWIMWWWFGFWCHQCVDYVEDFDFSKVFLWQQFTKSTKKVIATTTSKLDLKNQSPIFLTEKENPISHVKSNFFFLLKPGFEQKAISRKPNKIQLSV